MCTKFYEFMKKAFACGPDIMVKHCIHLGYMAPGSRVGNTRRQLMHTKWAPINLCVESNRYLSEYLGVLRFHVCSLCGWYIRHFWLNFKRINTFYLVCRHITVDLMELQNTLQFHEPEREPERTWGKVWEMYSPSYSRFSNKFIGQNP